MKIKWCWFFYCRNHTGDNIVVVYIFELSNFSQSISAGYLNKQNNDNMNYDIKAHWTLTIKFQKLNLWSHLCGATFSIIFYSRNAGLGDQFHWKCNFPKKNCKYSQLSLKLTINIISYNHKYKTVEIVQIYNPTIFRQVI